MRWAKVSCNSQFYLDYRAVYTLRVKKDHVNKILMSSSCIQSHGQASCGKNMFSIEAYKHLIDYTSKQ